MGLLVGDQLDNKTEANVALSVRIAGIGIGIGAVLAGIGFLLWGASHL